MLVDHVGVFFGEVSIQVFVQFSIGLFVLIVDLRGSLFWVLISYQICFTNVVSHCVSFLSLSVPSDAQTFQFGAVWETVLPDITMNC